jgi:hypothetical protein
MNENDLRDCFAMFAMTRMNWLNVETDAESCYKAADAMLEARKEDDGEKLGIAAVKPKRKYLRPKPR